MCSVKGSVGDSLPPPVSSLAPEAVVRTPGDPGRVDLTGQDSMAGWLAEVLPVCWALPHGAAAPAVSWAELVPLSHGPQV